MLLFVIGLPAAYYFYAAWSLEREISQALAETDAVDPRGGSRTCRRTARSFADEENSALQVVKVVRLLGRNAASLGYHKDHEAVFQKLSSPAQLNSQQVELIREAFEGLKPCSKRASSRTCRTAGSR